MKISCPEIEFNAVFIVVSGQILKKFFLICNSVRNVDDLCVIIDVGNANFKKVFLFVNYVTNNCFEF